MHDLVTDDLSTVVHRPSEAVRAVLRSSYQCYRGVVLACMVSVDEFDRE